MNLKSIYLKNIRSYKEVKVNFNLGRTLLSGDIGSGKTSILLGIEFALFGFQPGQKGSSILRNGETEGAATIEFLVDGKEITIERTLKKNSKNVTQDYSAITIEGKKEELSVTELKNRVLEILNYPKEFSKKQNILYKFTVYTPQEEMKQIILEDPETRINTLRHVFAIDKYKRILENISIVLQRLKEEKRVKEGMISNLEEDKEILQKKEEELSKKEEELILVKEDFEEKKRVMKEKQEEIETIGKKIEEKRSYDKEIEKTKIMISSKNELIFANEKTINNLNLQIKEGENLKIEDLSEKELIKNIFNLKENKLKLEELNLDVTSKINSLSIKNQENEDTKNNISKIDICPTCLQDVGDSHKSNVLNKVENDISKNIKQMEELILEKRKLVSQINSFEFEIESLEKRKNEINILKIKLQNLEEKKERIIDLEKNNVSLNKDILMLESQINELKKGSFELAKFENSYEEKIKIFEEKRREERISEIKLFELKKEIEVFSNQIKELHERIKKTEQLKKEYLRLVSLESWINQKFIPVISNVEKNVMVKLKHEFSKLFSHWFSMLVPENLSAKLSDNFTPIIEQGEHEIDYAYLSGGERTAIALAYRLSLNQVINSLLSKIKTKDLVILDEPTDGFSSNQLDKMRDVLQELKVKQLIVVSHEQKIESFVENVIKFQKEFGESFIEDNI